MSKVLVTGGTGFLAAHIIVQLLKAGHEVRTTVRTLARRDDLVAMLRTGGADTANLTLVEANLEADSGWADAVSGCDYVLHIASPFPARPPDNEDDLIRPARDGALRVLRAARDAGVKRVVMTSSFATIGYGHGTRAEAFTEDDWSDPNAPDVQAYTRSKIVAERAAWDFIEAEGGALELSVINPTGIFGPVLGPDFSTSISIIKSLLDGAQRFVPRVYFGAVDVRDAADLHLRAMTAPEAAGKRFIAVAGEPVSLKDVADILRQRLGDAADNVPRHQLPDWLVRIMARFVPALRGNLPQLGIRRRASNARARQMLGWQPRPVEETVTATAESLLALRDTD